MKTKSICATCSKEFEYYTSQSSGLYCSRACQARNNEKAADLSGSKFGRLTVLRFHSTDGNHLYWWCRCECGNERAFPGYRLRDSKTKIKNCGCFRVTTHGQTKTRTHRIWVNMHYRCTNPNAHQYSNYGGRGISVCAEWRSFEAFLQDMGPAPAGLQIERVDNSGNYCSGNCIWATPKVQARNRRTTIMLTAFGKTQSLSAWAEEKGIPDQCLRQRITKQHLDAETALTKPNRV